MSRPMKFHGSLAVLMLKLQADCPAHSILNLPFDSACLAFVARVSHLIHPMAAVAALAVAGTVTPAESLHMEPIPRETIGAVPVEALL